MPINDFFPLHELFSLSAVIALAVEINLTTCISFPHPPSQYVDLARSKSTNSIEVPVLPKTFTVATEN